MIQRSVQFQYLFLELEAMKAVKAVEDALEYIKMYEAGVSAKTAKGYLKIFRETSHSTPEQGLEQFIVLLKLKGTF